MSDYLVVPMKVDALVVPAGKRRAVIGQTTDYEVLPWFDGERDHYSSTPNIAPSINAEPFADHALWLESGVHLHWALPDGLTRGSTNPDTPGCVPVGDLHFPPVPNRWLVTRHAQPGRAAKRWLVSSDHVHPYSSQVSSIAYPFFDQPGRDWIRLGKQEELAEGESVTEGLSFNSKLSDFTAPLTALGPGDPSFSALYANCRSVFGCHDADDPEATTYDVLGWYTAIDDPLDAVITDAEAANVHPGEAVRERFGWVADDPNVPIPRKTLCFGRVVVGGDNASWDPQTLDRKEREREESIITEPITVGNTAAEAIAAMLAADAKDPAFERQLEAVNLAPFIVHHDLDFGLKFDEARHNAQFTAVAGHRAWALRPHGDSAAGAESGPVSSSDDVPPPLPHGLANQLHELNDLQRLYDQAHDRIDWMRQELYSRWQQLMTGLYAEPPAAPDNLDVSGIQALVEESYLGPLEAMLEEAGHLSGQGSAEGPGSSLAASILDQVASISTVLDKYNEGRQGIDQLELGMLPGPRYWQPNDPVVVLTDSSGQSLPRSLRHAADGELKCTMLLNVEFYAALAGEPGWTIDDYVHPSFFTSNPTILTYTDGMPWNPVLLEWEVELRSLAEGSNHEHAIDGAERKYATDFITASHRLPPMRAELDPDTSEPALAAGFEYVSGRTVLHTSSVEIMRTAVRTAIGEADRDSPAYDALRSIFDNYLSRSSYDSTMVQSLGGFNAALLMRCAEPQLPIADPIGFPHQQELASRVAAAMGDFHPDSVVPDAPFHPIRSGRMLIERLRLVDSFGQSREWRPGVVHTAETLHADVAQRVGLPPRITQPAMLSLRWVMADDATREMNDHPETGPICGWLLANQAERAIDVYDAEGHQLGIVDAGGRWQRAPGAVITPSTPGDIDNDTLADVVGWIITQPDTAGFISRFLDTTDSALNNIDPQDHTAHAARAMLIGRPMAIVTATIELNVAGLPAVDQSWRHLREQVIGAAPNHHGFTDVEFDIRVGERARLNDGLVAYWVIGANGELGNTWFTHYDMQEPPTLSVSVSMAPKRLVMLLDPRGSVHATSGILPTKELRLASTHYGAALESIAATFRTAPILTPASAVAVPLPDEPGFAWSWLQQMPTGWMEVPEQLAVDMVDVLAAFPGRGREIWDAAVSSGLLIPLSRAPQRALLHGLTKDYAPDPALPVIDDSVVRALHDVAKGIQPAKTDATFDSPTIVREGWLKLRPQPGPIKVPK